MPYASPAMLDLYGIEPAAVAETFAPIAMHIHPADAPLVQAGIAASASALSPWFAQFRYLHPHKGEIWVEGHSLPLRESDGGTLWHGYVQDITERKRAERVLQETQADLNRAQALGQIGSWRLDVQNDRLTWSPEAHRIFGIPTGIPLNYQTFLATVHPAGPGLGGRSMAGGAGGRTLRHRAPHPGGRPGALGAPAGGIGVR